MLLMELRWAGKARETLFMISDSLAFFAAMYCYAIRVLHFSDFSAL